MSDTDSVQAEVMEEKKELLMVKLKGLPRTTSRPKTVAFAI